MKKVFIISTIIMGILLGLQVRSFRNVQALRLRTDQKTILGELRVFQRASEQLSLQIREQQENLAAVQSQISNKSIEDELDRLVLQAGEQTVSGPGVEISFDMPIKAFWIVDMIAQLVSTGAEAIAFNNIRLLPRTAGFKDVAKGIVMRGIFLRPPYHFDVIGSSESLFKVLRQDGGIIERIEKNTPGIKILVTQKESISIKQVP